MAEDDVEAIRGRAYHIWERLGRPEGRADEIWDMAREELAIERNQHLATRPNPAAAKRTWDPADDAEPVTAAEEAFSDMPGPAAENQGEAVPYPFTPDAVPASADTEPRIRKRAKRKNPR